MIIGLLIGIVFFCLLAKALIETFWGACLIAYGLGCQLLVIGLLILAKIIRLIGNIRRRNDTVEQPKRVSISESWMLAHSKP